VSVFFNDLSSIQDIHLNDSSYFRYNLSIFNSLELNRMSSTSFIISENLFMSTFFPLLNQSSSYSLYNFFESLNLKKNAFNNHSISPTGISEILFENNSSQCLRMSSKFDLGL